MDGVMYDNQSVALLNRRVNGWNPLHIDAYGFHLAQLSSLNKVVVSRDVKSIAGALLMPEGETLSPEWLLLLQGAVLAEPLSECVVLEHLMTSDELHEHLLDVIRASEFFQALEERQYPLESLIPACEHLRYHPQVAQRLTVMASQLPNLFKRTLSVSLWALFISQEMRLAPESTQLLFWSALTHDIGMMHLSLDSPLGVEQVSADEWLYQQSHVYISCQVLRRETDFSDDLIVAVSEHHERCDGTGYPEGKVESEISLYGQILGLADSIVGIYYNRFRAKGLRWREIIPVLELNKAAYLHRSCEIIEKMILRSELPLANVVEGSQVPEFAEKMLAQNKHLQLWFDALYEALMGVGFTHGDRKLHSLQNVLLHIATTFKGSLLFEEGLRESIADFAATKELSISKLMEQVALNQQEMGFHLHRVSRMLLGYLESDVCANRTIRDKLLKHFQTSISGFLRKPPL